MPKFKFKKPWKRWNTGDVIDEYEYRRLPIEIKRSIIEKCDEEISAIPVPKIKNIMSGTVAEKLSSYHPEVVNPETQKNSNYFKPKPETPIERIIEEFTD